MEFNASGDICSLREREENRDSPARPGGVRCVLDPREEGDGGGRGVAGVTEMVQASDSGKDGRGRKVGARETSARGTGGADFGDGGILGNGRILGPLSAN